MHDSNLPDYSCRLRRRSSAFHAIPATDPQSVFKREAWQHVRPQSELGQRQEQWPALDGLRRRLSELAATPQQALDLIAQEALAATSAQGTAIALASDQAVVCCARAGQLGPPRGTPLDRQSGLSGECLRSGEVVCCHDTETDPRVDVEVCRPAGIRSVLAVPLRFEEQVIGIFVVVSARLRAFGYWEARRLQLLADLTSELRLLDDASPDNLSEIKTYVPGIVRTTLLAEKSMAEKENPPVAANANTIDSESHSGLLPSGRWAPARSRHVSKCLEMIRQDPALQLLGRAKAYLTIEALHDGTDRSHPIALFEKLMLQRVAEIGVDLNSASS